MIKIGGNIKKKILAVKDVGYTGEFGLQELVDRCQDVLANEEIAHEKALVQKFFDTLSKKPLQVAYGEIQVRKAMEASTADIVLLSEDLPDAVLEEFEEKAEAFGTKVEVISTETREGVQLRDMGRYAAILRYEVH